MAATTVESNHSIFNQVIEDQSFEKELGSVSSTALEAADALEPMQATAKKVAYYWIKADLNDPVVSSEYSKEGREACIQTLSLAGYDVTILKGNREFLEHTAKDPTHPDLLLIHGHGNPWCLEDFVIEDDHIVSTDPNLSEFQRADIIDRVRSILDEGSVVALKSCATGNKSVENNFACTASKTWTKSKIMAFQELVHGPPILHLEEAEDGSGKRIKNLRAGCRKLRSLETAVTYEKGEEISGQKAMRLPRMFRPQKRHRMATIVASATFLGGAAVCGFAAAAYMGFSPYNVVDITVSTLSSLF